MKLLTSLFIFLTTLSALAETTYTYGPSHWEEDNCLLCGRPSVFKAQTAVVEELNADTEGPSLIIKFYDDQGDLIDEFEFEHDGSNYVMNFSKRRHLLADVKWDGQLNLWYRTKRTFFGHKYHESAFRSFKTSDI